MIKVSQNTSNKLGTEKISRLLFQLALPAITAQIINMLYNIVDRIYIGPDGRRCLLSYYYINLCFQLSDRYGRSAPGFHSNGRTKHG